MVEDAGELKLIEYAVDFVNGLTDVFDKQDGSLGHG